MKDRKINRENTEVTILIPTFNRSGYLQEAINSALKQTYPCKIIVCDHASTDDTPQVMQKYKDKVQYIRREEDFGPHFCWLDGVLHTQTKYVKILFDDDWLDSTFVEKTISLMQADVSCVITNAKISYENDGKKKTGRTTFFNKTGVFRKNLIESEILLLGGVISPTCCLFRREEVIEGIYQGKLPKKGGSYYHGVGPDMFIMLLGFLRYKKIGFINEDLATFRAHEKSITIDATKKNDTKGKIQNAYGDVIEFYSFLKLYKIFKVLYYISPMRISRKILINQIESIKKIVKKFTKGVF